MRSIIRSDLGVAEIFLNETFSRILGQHDAGFSGYLSYLSFGLVFRFRIEYFGTCMVFIRTIVLPIYPEHIVQFHMGE